MTAPATPPFRIDVHHHLMPAPTGNTAPLGGPGSASGWTMPEAGRHWTPEKSLAFMDALGIATTILSQPGDIEHDLPVDARRAWARDLNTTAARIADEHTGRFGFFAHLPTPTDVEGALAELGHAVDELGAAGVVLTNVYGSGRDAVSLGDLLLEPLWAELDRRGTLVFLHGAQTPGSNPIPNSLLPVPVSEVPNETYKGAADLVTSGRKRQFPNVRIVLSHLGGSTPFLAARVAGLSSYLDSSLTPDEIIDDFRTFYYDTALAGFETNLVALESFVPPEQIVFGTDFPSIPLETAQWYTANVDAYFAGRPDVLDMVMHANVEALLPGLFRTPAA
jgi:6-methylsalicylate decarboxylase